MMDSIGIFLLICAVVYVYYVLYRNDQKTYDNYRAKKTAPTIKPQEKDDLLLTMMDGQPFYANNKLYIKTHTMVQSGVRRTLVIDVDDNMKIYRAPPDFFDEEDIRLVNIHLNISEDD